ncbi:N-alpha-acetyltransferase-like protein 15 [Phyllosticta citriasiana]|uniref:N-alpha-acetyltransferase-like protein 15 n=1 Tax=Phyllosticta citriasiana TaxID=595635 RepID=UPI0030FD9F16
MPQPLSSKENSLFRQLVKNYETKQYKKGIKAADQILKKVPNHGDTQAMKALILNSQGQTDEAFALAKTALKNDVKSHICWHVYGILYRSAKNYDEAIKAYKFALRLEPESIQIQRDLATLQIQVRDYNGYIESRKTMVKSRPQIRQNWTALAVAYHLAGDYTAAIDTLERFEGTLKQPPPRSDLEHSEASIYKNTVIAEKGDIEAALKHLDTIYKTNADRTAVMELRAQYLLQLDKSKEAEEAYRDLLERNNEYRLYYNGLEKSLGLERSNPEHVPKLLELYESYAEKFPRLDAARRIPLDFLSVGDKFRTAADSYLRRQLNRGVPSTFANVKALYQDSEKKQIIQELVLGYENEKQANGDKPANGDSSNQFHEVVLYFLAQNYNYHLSRDLPKALQYIERTIELNPKFVDYTMTKARIWKHLGNTPKAAEIMNQARELDGKDRYINTKCAKYQLRNNQNEDAIATMSKFTRNEAVGGALGDLHDMQCMWYITEDGEAYLRRGEIGLALKRFQAIFDIFGVWEEDQFDFHTFSLRKGQVRAYVDMIRWEDHLREHPFYTRAALSAIKTYVLLHDKPELKKPITNGDESQSAKAKKKAQQEKEAQKALKKPALDANGEPKKEDTDPEGVKLRETETPLDDAMKWLGPLLSSSPKSIEAQNAGFEVFIRRKKHLLALKCLLSAHAIDPENPTLHHQIIRFQQERKSCHPSLSISARRQADTVPVEAFAKAASDADKPVLEVLKSQFTLIPAGTSAAAFNTAFLERHAKSAPHVVEGLRARVLLDPSTKAKSEDEAVKAVAGLETAQLADALAVRDALREWGSAAEALQRWEKEVKARWNEAAL